MVCYGWCTYRCGERTDCGPSPEWGCDPSYGACRCASTGPELCDGRDNDCNGKVDDGASCDNRAERCQRGSCVCPNEASCNGQCRDLRFDATHCGACGVVCPVAPHADPACGDGLCDFDCHDGWSSCDGDPSNGCEQPGECEVETLLDVGPSATRLAFDGTRVYWSDSAGAGGKDRVLALLPSVGVDVVAGEMEWVADLIGTPGAVFWTEVRSLSLGLNGVSQPGTGAVWRRTATSGEVESMVEQDFAAPYLLAELDGTPYWLSLGNMQHWGATPHTLHSFVGGGAMPLGPVLTGVRPVALEVWKDWGYHVSDRFLHRVTLACLSGGSLLGEEDNEYASVSADATGVYWVLGRSLPDAGRLDWTDHAGARRSALLAQGVRAAVVGSTFIWATTGDGVVRLRKHGGGARLIAPVKGAGAIAASMEHIYWFASDPTGSAQSLQRIRKQ
jgi:hypothetical protein